jgi:hypothetical protein
MAKKQIQKKGGSVASNRVNALVPNFSSTPCKFKENTSTNNVTNKFLKNNYGSFFKTQGGKRNTKKKGGNNQYDTFKNYLVPFKGKENFSNLYETNFTNTPSKNSNRGGKKSIKKKIKQRGSSGGPMSKRGDSNMLTGATIPPTTAQGIQNVWDGVTSVFTDKASDVTFPSGLQLACNNTDCSSNTDNINYVNQQNDVNGFPTYGIQKTQGLTFPEAEFQPVLPGNMTAPRAGGKRVTKNKRKSIKKIQKTGGKKTKKRTIKKNKRSNKKKNQSGYGSDFKSTLASGGPYNYPNSTWHYSGENGVQAAKNNFRAFNKTSQYIPNRILANGAANIPEPQQYLIRDPYVNPWVTSSKLSGKNPEGISTKNFSGAGKKKIKNII